MPTHALSVAAAGAVVFTASVLAQAPMTGSGGISAVDSVIQGLLSKYQVPGAALAVTNQGRLVYARGYGYADTATQTPVQPDSIFRQASISKTFTAAAILVLVDQGKLGLDDPAFSYLSALAPPPAQIADSRISQITIRQCLNHTGGWDRSIVGDPVDQSIQIAERTGAPLPGSAAWFISYMWTQPLQHQPGTVYAYSNVGYVVLGAVIESVTGMRYEDFVRAAVLKPLGIEKAILTDPAFSDSAFGEVTYYPYPGESCQPSLIPYQNGACVPSPYSDHNFDVAMAAGGWAVTEIDLMRFLNGFPSLFHNPSTLQQMQTPTAAFSNPKSFYGLGFSMQADGSGFDWNKDGSLPGTSSFLHRRPNGFAWAVVFNMRPNQSGSTVAGDEGGSFESDFVNQLETVFPTVTFPSTDQFPSFPSTLPAPQVNAVVQSATGTPGIVSGSWATIYGLNLSAANRLWWPSEFNGTSLPQYVDHVEVSINGHPCAVHYVSPGQINVQAPSGLTAGTAQVVLSHDGQISNSFTAVTAAAAPGFFTYTVNGISYAAAQHTSDYSTVGITAQLAGTRPAVPGETLAFYGSGFAAAPAGAIVASSTSLPGPVAATVGGRPAAVTPIYLVGAGLFQVNITVPASGLSAGNQPVVVTYNGQPTQPGVVIPVLLP